MPVQSYLPLLAIASLAAGCTTYAQHRAALVPHQTPIPITGQPMRSKGELALGASNATDLQRPTSGASNAGNYVPDTQLRGALGLRATPNFSLRALYERGMSSTAHKVSPSVPPRPDRDLSGMGFGMTYSIPTGSPWRVGVTLETLVWNVPWVQYTSCVEYCDNEDRYTYFSSGTDLVPTLGLGIVPSYKEGSVTVFGGATARNHPTLTEKVYTVVALDPDVKEGPFNVTLQAGVEVMIGSGVRANVQLHQTVTTDPVRYGPGLGVGLTLPLGDVDAPTGS